MAFIIGTYDKYDTWDRSHSVYKFELNGIMYAIMEVELEWGLPQLPSRIEYEEHPEQYCVYGKYEDALQFVKQMKQLNAR